MTLMDNKTKEFKDQNGFTPHAENDTEVQIEDEIHVTDDALIYGVTDNPPIHLTVLFAFQVRVVQINC